MMDQEALTIEPHRDTAMAATSMRSARAVLAPHDGAATPLAKSGPKLGQSKAKSKPGSLAEKLGLLTFEELLAELNLPRKWSRQQVAAKRWPCLRIGVRFYFDPGAVAYTLQARAKDRNQDGEWPKL